MSKFEELTNCIKKFSHDDLQQLLGLVTCMLSNIPAEKPCCPYCGSANVIRYGLKRGKQRFLCKHGYCHPSHKITVADKCLREAVREIKTHLSCIVSVLNEPFFRNLLFML